MHEQKIEALEKITDSKLDVSLLGRKYWLFLKIRIRKTNEIMIRSNWLENILNKFVHAWRKYFEGKSENYTLKSDDGKSTVSL